MVPFQSPRSKQNKNAKRSSQERGSNVKFQDFEVGNLGDQFIKGESIFNSAMNQTTPSNFLNLSDVKPSQNQKP